MQSKIDEIKKLAEEKISKINQSQIETHFDKVFCGFLFKVRNRQATTKTVPACFR